jgi:hypothetical protein
MLSAAARTSGMISRKKAFIRSNRSLTKAT